MGTKLFLLLIFSSLTSLSYSQKLTKEDFQGLWYVINNSRSFDSVYNIRYDSIIFVDEYRSAIEKIPSIKKSTAHSSRITNSLLDQITVLTGGFGALYGNQELLEVFEVKNDEVTFFTNIFFSDLVYDWEDEKLLEEKFGKNFTSQDSCGLFNIEYKINGNVLSLKQNYSDKWTENEILY